MSLTRKLKLEEVRSDRCRTCTISAKAQERTASNAARRLAKRGLVPAGGSTR